MSEVLLSYDTSITVDAYAEKIWEHLEMYGVYDV